MHLTWRARRLRGHWAIQTRSQAGHRVGSRGTDIHEMDENPQGLGDVASCDRPEGMREGQQPGQSLGESLAKDSRIECRIAGSSHRRAEPKPRARCQASMSAASIAITFATHCCSSATRPAADWWLTGGDSAAALFAIDNKTKDHDAGARIDDANRQASHAGRYLRDVHQESICARLGARREPAIS
jgi:hypothetical protein